MEQIFLILGIIGIGSGCLPISFCFSNLKKSLATVHWSLLVLSVVYFLTNVISLVLFLDKNLIQENFFNLHFLLELFLLSAFFLSYIKPTIFLKLSVLGIFFFFIIASAFHHYGSIRISGSISLLSNIMLIIYSVYYIVSQYSFVLTEKLTKNGEFLIVFSVLFYAGVQFYFSLFDLMIRDDSKQIFYYLWPILQIGGIIYYICFTYGLWKLIKS